MALATFLTPFFTTVVTISDQQIYTHLPLLSMFNILPLYIHVTSFFPLPICPLNGLIFSNDHCNWIRISKSLAILFIFHLLLLGTLYGYSIKKHEQGKLTQSFDFKFLIRKYERVKLISRKLQVCLYVCNEHAFVRI